MLEIAIIHSWLPHAKLWNEERYRIDEGRSKREVAILNLGRL